jgi:LysR family hydrogen peroxide-inducible transcriptional activator
VEIHQLRYFVAVVQQGSFTRGAAACGVSQPSLSQAIARLEAELQQPLLERLGRGVKLTRAGEELLHRAGNVLSELDEARRTIAAGANGRGQVAVGAIPTIAPYVLPAALATFARRYPHAELSVYEEVTARLVERLLAGQIDVALLSLPLDESGLHIEPLVREELFVALPRGHALVKKRRITLGDIAGQPFILLSEAHCLADQVVAFCRERECLPAVSCISAQLLTVQELVAQGRGVSLVPAMARKYDKSRRVEYRSLAGQRPMRLIALAWSAARHQRPLVRHFEEHVRKMFAS